VNPLDKKLFRWRDRVPWSLIILSLAVISALLAICTTVLVDMRSGDELVAKQASDNLAVAIDSDLTRTLEVYDLSLHAVANNLAIPELRDVSKTLSRLILFDHSATASYFGSLQVVDPAGNVTIDSARMDPPSFNYADEEFFQIHKRDPIFGLFISRPMLHNGAYGIVLSRRISARDGSFLGVAVGFIKFTYFHDMMERLQLNAGDIITIIRQDGIVIMRRPFDLDVIGRDLSRSPVIQKVLSTQSGFFEGSSAIDNVKRRYFWKEGFHPLIVIVGRPLNDIYGRWRDEAVKIGSILMLLAGCAIFLVSKESRRRAVAERQLQALAETDALTGLSNRRGFDLMIEREWQDAIRQERPLSLLMIDADHFKSYNDRHGHQAGDTALRMVALCISGLLPRMGGGGARYGGEEFAVLLAGLSLEQAVEVGERIRQDVEKLSFSGVPVTVSVGAACVIPSADETPEGLVHAADLALYEAKARGRNQTRSAPDRIRRTA
jgi:diguanylate cyclase (GGDEF)-like protein